jgi:short-subunit dehydrogenase
MAAPRWATDRFRHRYGPWAVVTGASSGMGRETALALAAADVGTVLVARRGSSLDEVATEVRRAGGDARVVVVDLAAPDATARIAEETADLDIGLLVAAAGFGALTPFTAGDRGVDRRMTTVNVGAVTDLAHVFAERLAARGRGGLVLFGSIVGRQGVPLQAHYAATKAYVHSLAEALAVELRPSGVDVLLVAPGPVDSGFADAAGMRMGAALPARDVPGPVLAALGRRRTVVPGTQARILTAALATMPRAIRVRVMHRVVRGFVDERERSPHPVRPPGG